MHDGKTSDAQKRATRRYMSKFVEVKTRMTAERREVIHDHAARMGESTNAFINRAIKETIERDKK